MSITTDQERPMRSNRIRMITSTSAIAAVLAGGAASIASAAPAAPAATVAAVRHYEGTVTSVNRDARTFRLRDSERGTVRIRVTGSTRYERLAGFSSLKRGTRNIEATVRRSGGRWIATLVERSGGGGDHGNGRDDDGSGDDRGRGRGSDD
jgi:hypothetical protein